MKGVVKQVAQPWINKQEQEKTAKAREKKKKERGKRLRRKANESNTHVRTKIHLYKLCRTKRENNNSSHKKKISRVGHMLCSCDSLNYMCFSGGAPSCDTRARSMFPPVWLRPLFCYVFLTGYSRRACVSAGVLAPVEAGCVGMDGTDGSTSPLTECDTARPLTSPVRPPREDMDGELWTALCIDVVGGSAITGCRTWLVLALR